MSVPAPTVVERNELRRYAEEQRFAPTTGLGTPAEHDRQRRSEILIALLDAYERAQQPKRKIDADAFQEKCLRTVNVRRAAELLGTGADNGQLMTVVQRHLLTLLLCSNGIGGEAGEVIEPIKKHVFHGKDLDRAALSKEIGDVMWYLAVLAHEIGYPLSQIMSENVAKLEARHGLSAEPEWARTEDERGVTYTYRDAKPYSEGV